MLMLISHSSLLLFVAGAAVLLVIPGPAVTYVVSRSIGHGRAAGLVSVLGIVTGKLCHVVAAGLGAFPRLGSFAGGVHFWAAHPLLFWLVGPACEQPRASVSAHD